LNALNVGNNIKAAMAKKNVKQSDICEHLQLRKSTMSSYVNGHTTPDVFRLKQIAEYLGVSTDELLDISATQTLSSLVDKYGANEVIRLTEAIVNSREG
jgi:transcriptional regulator with XRE-family HTH domain